MRSALWSKVLGVCLGILIGAGVAYAATYEYRAEVPSGVTVASEVETVPGLQVTPTSLDFGEIAPGQSSDAISVELTNIGSREANIYLDVTDLPQGFTVYRKVPWSGSWRVIPDTTWTLGVDETVTIQFYLSCSEDVADSQYDFTIVISEP